MNEIIVRALIDVLTALEVYDDDSVSPEAATAIFEDVVSTLGNLTSAERFALVRLIEQAAVEERNEVRREVISSLPENLDLLDEAEE